jgi:hypothetical protein
MVFWIAILVGCMTLYLATRIGFFDTLVLSFNVLTSIYVGIYSAPAFINLVPSAANFACGTATTVSAISLICFLCLYGLSYVLLTGQFKVAFPKVFDVLLSGVIGFCTGFLLISYTVFILSILPPLRTMSWLDTTNTKVNVSLVCLYCDQIQHLVAARDAEQQTQDVLTQIIQKSQENVPSSVTDVDPNQSSDG